MYYLSNVEASSRTLKHVASAILLVAFETRKAAMRILLDLPKDTNHS